ncbi:hypothetical protein KTS45_17685 [Halomicroarcula limicola]|uniref:Uncharacterized protein n=1 Tax=Haloarcula limicola TaxID=1429915 RepID=A0A8J8C6B5_9EURY|nr:hypothetical protein [Halomicroarcula limicola]MBV0926039.1 hypothetical protein [Halomicroarcula limicola]
MDRRRLLASLAAAGTAGCLSAVTDPNGTPDRESTNTLDDGSSDTQRSTCQVSESTLSAERVSPTAEQRTHVVPIEYGAQSDGVRDAFAAALDGETLDACPNRTVTDGPERALPEALAVVEDALQRQRRAYDGEAPMPKWVERAAYLRREDEMYVLDATLSDIELSRAESPAEPATSSPEPSASRYVYVTNTAEVPAGVDLRFTAVTERSEVTDDATATLLVSVRNTGADRAVDAFEGEGCHLFNRSRGGSTPAGLWLYRAQNAPGPGDDGRWTRDREETNSRTYDAYGCGMAALSAGEAVVTRYAVWDDYATSGYLEPGTYRFDVTLRVGPSEDSDDWREVPWWVELAVVDPDD